MIEFNKPPFIGTELEYIRQAAEENNKLCGDGPFTKKCSAWMQDNFNVKHAILTTSCTHALEMAAYLSEIQPGDEVIMPSYTFVSTADAFVLRGAKIVYVDIRPDTMNIDETGSIGKRYRREDEIGTPFCITFDFETVGDENTPADHCVTVRERDTMQQVRMPISEVKAYLREKCAF